MERKRIFAADVIGQRAAEAKEVEASGIKNPGEGRGLHQRLGNVG